MSDEARVEQVPADRIAVVQGTPPPLLDTAAFLEDLAANIAELLAARAADAARLETLEGHIDALSRTVQRLENEVRKARAGGGRSGGQ